DGAQAVERSLKQITSAHIRRSAKRTGHNDFSGAEAYAEFSDRVGEPSYRHRWMAQYRTPGAGLNDVAVFLEHHTNQLQVALIDPLRRVAEHDPCRRGVVGDGIAEFDLRTLDSAVDDLTRRHNTPGRCQILRRSDTWSLQVAIENEGNFRLDLGLNQFANLEDRSILQHHVIKNVAIIGLIDVEHFLHRLAREADLLAHDLGAVGLLHLDQRQLNSVGLFRVDLRILFRKWTKRALIFFGFIELTRFLMNLLLSQSFHDHNSILTVPLP